MLTTEQEQVQIDIARWVAQYGRGRSSLLPILQEIQKSYTRISDHAMQVVADMLGIHPVEVYGVVSFYSFLDHLPKGRFVVRLCRTISCDMQGKDRVADRLKHELGIGFGQTTSDGVFTLEWANCIGMCDQGPALLVNERVFTRVTPENVPQIVEELRQQLSAQIPVGREGRQP